MRFADIPGHEDVKARLRDMVDNNRLPHALLIEGPAGCGKYALARALTTYIHCTNRRDGDSCGVCEACRQHASFNHIDTFYSFPVVKKNSKPTVSNDYFDEFKEFIDEEPFMDFSHWLKCLGNDNAQPQIYVEEASALLERLNLTARQSRFKVVLMWLPERLHASAANKLLKLVEEPSADTMFIMSSNKPSDILPTIYSRVQRVGVRRYSDAEVARILINNGIDAPTAESVAILAAGNVNAAMTAIKGNEDNTKLLDLYKELMRKAWTRKVKDLRKWSKDIGELGREGQMRFYTYCSRMTRNNFILNLQQPALAPMDADEATFSSRFSAYITDRNVEGIMQEFDRAVSDTAANGNARIIAFDLAVKMIKWLRK